MGENVWWFLADHCGLDKVWLWDHSSTTSAKMWVGGVRKWQFLLFYSTIYADVGGWVGLKKQKKVT